MRSPILIINLAALSASVSAQASHGLVHTQQHNTKAVWRNLLQPIQQLWDDKAKYISGILLHDYLINVEEFPRIIDFINTDEGCWCHSLDRSKILGHKSSDQYDAICKQYHKCTECAFMNSCQGFHKDDWRSIHIRGHSSIVYGSLDGSGEEVYDKWRLRCNKRDQCKKGLCECMKFLYREFAKLIADDLKQSFLNYEKDLQDNPDTPEEKRLLPIDRLYNKRIEGSDDVCHPVDKSSELEQKSNMENIFGPDTEWARSFNLDQLNSAASGNDVADLFGPRSGSLNPMVSTYGQQVAAEQAGLPTLDLADLPSFMRRYEILLKDFEALAKEDMNYIYIYEKLLTDYGQFLNEFGENYNPADTPQTILEALKIFNSQLPPKDHEKQWWMSQVLQDDHEDMKNNNACCGELPYWTPYNTDGGTVACCGKKGDHSSWHTYSINFNECCDNEIKGLGEGGSCLGNSEVMEEYYPVIDETEYNEYEEDEKTKKRKILPDTFMPSPEDLEDLDMSPEEKELLKSVLTPSASGDAVGAGYMHEMVGMGDGDFENFFAGLDVDLSNLNVYGANEMSRSFTGESPQSSDEDDEDQPNPLVNFVSRTTTSNVEYWSKAECLVDLPAKFAASPWKVNKFCKSKAEKNETSLYGNNKFLYPDRTCRFYIDCDLPEEEVRFFKCGNTQKFDGNGCMPDSVYTDTECGIDMTRYDYGMTFEYHEGNNYNHLASLNYDDTCMSKSGDETDDKFCDEQCGCEAEHCKGCQEEVECQEKCMYKTVAGEFHLSKKMLFCHHLKPEESNMNNLWTDWTCKSYIHCEVDNYAVRHCGHGMMYSARDDACVNEQAEKRCGQWFKKMEKDHRNYLPTWSNTHCVFSRGEAATTKK